MASKKDFLLEYGYMEEIWKMWKVARILKKNRAVWALALVELDALSTAHQETMKRLASETINRERNHTQEEMQHVIDNEKRIAEYHSYQKTNSYHKEATVRREAIVNTYIFIHHKELCSENENGHMFKDILSKDFRKRKVEINSIIQSCIDSKIKLISTEDGDPSRVYLTQEGKKFAGINGLIKAEANELGITSSIIIALVVGGIAGYVARNTRELVNILWKLIRPHLGL